MTKSEIPFVSIRADHACQHVNKLLKVHCGLIGISNNPNSRQRFFIAAPELSNLPKEFKSQFSNVNNNVSCHHDLSPAEVKRYHKSTTKIKIVISARGNPFAVEGQSLYNFITHAYIPDEYVPHILNMDDTGQKLCEEYVTKRINGNISLWTP